MENGDTVEFDAVIFCTGYTPSFPFLDSSCQTVVADGRIHNLYKMIVHTKVPGLYFTGMTYYNAFVLIAAMQGEFIMAVITGRVTLPTTEKMEEDIERHYAEFLETGKATKWFHSLDYNEAKYCEEVECLAGLKPIPQVIHRMMEKVLDLGLKEKKYITMRGLRFEAIDDDTYEIYED